MIHLRATWNFLLIVLTTIVCLALQVIVFHFKSPFAKVVPRLYHGIALRVMGMRVHHYGEVSTVRPTLFVVNHSSWLDIVVMNTLATVSFVAKREVASWPIIGYFAVLQSTVFVERLMQRTADTRDEMTVRLEAGDSLALFAEGTSSDGNRVLPFKSGFFSVAEKPIRGRPLIVQPVTIAYTKLNGVPLGRQMRPLYTWFGDMELFPHLWGVLGAGPATATVQFHRPVTIADFTSRKNMAAHCQNVVAQGLSDALSGCLEESPSRRYLLFRPDRPPLLDSQRSDANVTA
ncbi:MAG: 1-acyl-sn-glycerol-3-phosphate acyltransferase [Alphaproteobacteria bacterium]|nr:1-acyl-sn-glycerol-3-phosphate acyltransferase [Alphaproteobacteria bacterium]